MFTVFIVDDDPSVLKSLARLIRLKGYDVRPYTSPHEFLIDHDPTIPGCAILDMSMPGLNGLELQRALTSGGYSRPIIFVTGRGDVPTSVQAMKAGALDFLTKPVSNKDLLSAIASAVEQDAKFRQANAEIASVEAKITTLTPRELEVLTQVAAGRLNKQIAYHLGTTEKTIKFHRSSMMKKLGVRAVADLVRIAQKAGVSV